MCSKTINRMHNTGTITAFAAQVLVSYLSNFTKHLTSFAINFLSFFDPKKSYMQSLLSLKHAVVYLRGLSNQFKQMIVFKAWPDCSVDSKIVGLATFIQQPPSGPVCSARSNSDAKQQSSN